ncbi:hypothetical protein C0Q70_12846 [Pomacea canaliculata]|uniref:Uncharacterized protein n=1 Tax=Pomacea canaliculata TaxID=400727 RepID=A0A2T7P2N3_POMCA|nr:hypothetical protein C0Q70_12846 [Pomacea canaliculata]
MKPYRLLSALSSDYTYSELSGIVAGVVVAMVVLNVISVIVTVFVMKKKIKDDGYSKPMRMQTQHIYLDINNSPTGHDGHDGGFRGIQNPRMPGDSDDTASTYDSIK